MLKKILYADAGSSNSQQMLKALQVLPSIQNAHITILHVVPPQITKDAENEKIEQGRQLIEAEIKNLGLDSDQVTTILQQGEPKDTVLSVAAEVDADLIVMGSRGLGRLEAILGNSVSQYVFQLSDRPMLLVRDDIYVKRLKRIMVALDKSPAAQYTLDLAFALVQGYSDANLYLARVNPDLNPDLLPLSRQEMEQNPIVAPALAAAKRRGIKATPIVTGGKPAQSICQLVDEYNIDLLMLGSPDRRPAIAKSLPDLDRLLGTSLSDYVRVKANCPVLLARTNED